MYKGKAFLLQVLQLFSAVLLSLIAATVLEPYQILEH